MTDSIERLPNQTQSPLEERVERLRETFPEVFREDKVDFDALKRSLGERVDVGKERFGLSWPGKAGCMRVLAEPSVGTLVPMREESVNFDATGNLIVEGDNLEVLKILQKSYYGKVKLIYIDPPYNTGNEFIYPDKFREGLQDYLRYSGQVDAEGLKTSTNTESDGRFHSKWLNMMYPRLFLARNLMREDGVVFISIDDHEVHHLRSMMNEIFGEENFLAELVWEKTRKNDAKFFSVGHEYILCYGRSVAYLREEDTRWREPKPGADDVQNKYIELRSTHGANNTTIESDLRAWYSSLPNSTPAKALSRYKNVDDRGVWRDRDISWPGKGGPNYDVIHPTTGLPCKVPASGWRFSTPESMQEQIAQGLVMFRHDHTEPPFRKAYLSSSSGDEVAEEDDDTAPVPGRIGLQVMPSVIYRQAQVAAKYLRSVLGGDLFENPKDHEILARLIAYTTSRGDSDLVLDFFAGSGSTADAVLRQNASDGGNRRFLLIQLPEPTKEGSDANMKGYRTISSLTRDRVRRVSALMNQKSGTELEGISIVDVGFRALRLESSNLLAWSETLAGGAKVEDQIEAFAENVRPNRSPHALLTEILLRDGYSITATVEKLDLSGKEVYSVDSGALLVCLDRKLTLEVIEAMVERQPAKIVCLDAGFQNDDTLKVNAVQSIRARGKSGESSIVFRVI